MNAIVLKWLTMSLVATVVLGALWLAGSVRGQDPVPLRDAGVPAPTSLVAQAR